MSNASKSLSIVHLKLIASLKNIGERIFFTFTSLYADFKGATAFQQGILLSFQNLLAFASQNIFGRAGDKFGRFIILLIGFSVSILSSFFMLGSVTPVSIIFIFALYNIGFSAIQPTFSALIGDTFQASDRAKMIGSIGGFASILGGSIYLLAGLGSKQVNNPYSFLFLISFFSFSGALLSVVLLRITNYFPRTVLKSDFNKSVSLFDPLRVPSFRRFVLVDSLFFFAVSTTWPLFPKTTNELATPQQVTIIWFISFIGYGIAARNADRIKNKMNNWNLSFFFSRFFLWFVPITFAFATSWIHLLLIRIVAGTTFGFYQTIQMDYILDTCQVVNRPEDRGFFLGTHAFIFGLFTFFGSLLAGTIFDYLLSHYSSITYKELFIATAIVRLITVFGYLGVQKPTNAVS